MDVEELQESIDLNLAQLFGDDEGCADTTFQDLAEVCDEAAAKRLEIHYKAHRRLATADVVKEQSLRDCESQIRFLMRKVVARAEKRARHN